MKRIVLLFAFFATAGLFALSNNLSNQSTARIGAVSGGTDPLVPDVLWWKCNDGSGTNIHADVGSDGTTGGTWSVNGSGFALTFSGTIAEAVTNSNVTIGNPAITMSLWVNSSDWTSGSSQYILYNWNGTSTDAEVVVTSSVLNVIIYGTGGTKLQRAYTPPAGGSYKNLLIVMDRAASSGAGAIAYYEDGVFAAGTLIQNDKTGESGNFSPSTFSTGYRITGSVDDLRIFSGDRSSIAAAITSAGPQ